MYYLGKNLKSPKESEKRTILQALLDLRLGVMNVIYPKV